MNSELRSVSGDVGNYVAGGRAEYMILWDVLKDVEKLESAEFIVRAELMKKVTDDNTGTSGKLNNKKPESTWKIPKFNAFYTMEFPGPHLGVRLAYAGRFGVSASYLTGRAAWDKSGQDLVLDYLPSDVNEWKQTIFGSDLMVRIVNTRDIQMHFMAGVCMSNFAFYADDTYYSSQYVITHENLIGPELGLVMGIKFMTVTIGVVHFDPKNVEEHVMINGSNIICMYPLSYFRWGVGFRF